jgi:hypothetical protein
MEKLVRSIRKAPLLLWLFLALTQFLGIFSSYGHWQTANLILADWRKHPSILADWIQEMEIDAAAEYRAIWLHSVLLVVFLACAAIKRGEKHAVRPC